MNQGGCPSGGGGERIRNMRTSRPRGAWPLSALPSGRPSPSLFAREVDPSPKTAATAPLPGSPKPLGKMANDAPRALCIFLVMCRIYSQ